MKRRKAHTRQKEHGFSAGEENQARNAFSHKASQEGVRRSDRVRARTARVRTASEKIITRVLAGALYSVAVLICTLLGPIALAVAFSAMSWLCASELYRLVRMMGSQPNEYIGLFIATILPWCALISYEAVLAGLLVLLLASGLWYIFSQRTSFVSVAATVAVAVYTGLLLCAPVAIRELKPVLAPFDDGASAALTFFTIGSVWLSDIMAYFVGSHYGKHALMPKVSPKKTWEGFIAGLVGCVAVWVFMWALGFMHISLPFACCAGVLIGLFAVCGDLFESRIKRQAQVKDSGTIMPGHGGMLDRSDSLLFGVSLAYWLLVTFGGFI